MIQSDLPHAAAAKLTAASSAAGVRSSAGAGAQRKPLRICFVGWGAIAQRAAQLLLERNPARVDLVGVAVRETTKPRPDVPENTRVILQPGQLEDMELDLVVEAAGRDCVQAWASAALRTGADFMIASTSAFTDENLMSEIIALAERSQRRVIMPPGALGGIDALGAAALAQLTHVKHTIIKPPSAWRSTKAAEAVDLDAIVEPVAFFEGTAREAADQFPKNANVAIISAMAGLGLDNTNVTLVADPSAKRNTHRIHADGEFGRLEICLENAALKSNPKSSEMTALNIVRAVENQINTLVL